ncbi:MAG: hypothetical protein CBE24_04295 [bacterium TMED264]|nr:MAG: hypothetical protein CBE24_04295 [bacterium TMED264]|tara:strand:- start:239 stop:601 length:363 start_codon:yes stop_codon:yes gene_type:complete
MKKITFLILSVFLYSNDSQDVLDQFILNYLLLTESKIESSPTVWQDIKDGYVRNYTLRFTNTLLDSIGNNELSSFHAGLRHFQKIENLRAEIKKGGEYRHTIVPSDTPRFNINFFYSSFK